MSELPQGWEWTTLAQISQIKGGITKGQKRGPSAQVRSVPYLRVANVQRGRLDLTSIKEIEATEEEIYELRLIRDDLLFTEGGDRDKLGRGWVWNDEIPECIHQNHIFRARLGSQKLNAKYVSWYCNQVGAEYFLSQAKQTTNLASINITKLGQLPIALAPVNEQKRIADKLDSLLARVDACRERLDRVPGILKRFRQAVLAAATSGELTREWREPDSGPPSGLVSGGVAPQSSDRLFPIPPTWQWTTFGVFASSFRSGTSSVPQENVTDRPVLRSSSVRNGFVDFADVRYLSPSLSIRDNDYLADGDLLFTRLSGSLEYVANCALVKGLGTKRIIYPDRLFRAKLHDPSLGPYLELCFGSPILRAFLEVESKSTAGHQRISMGAVTGFPIPLPPAPERAEIVRRVESLLATASRLDIKHKIAIAEVERLTPSLLSKAFRGELVPQDPNDEPASELLARIRAAGTEPPMVKRGRKAGAR